MRITKIRKINNMNVLKMINKFIYDSDADLHSRAHEELLAQLALKYTKNFETSLNKKALDALYDDNNRLSPRVEKEMRAVVGAMAKMANKVPSNFTTKLTKGQFHVVADAIQIAYALGYSITDYTEFLSWILTVDATATAAAKKLTEEESDRSYIKWVKYYYVKKNNLASRQLLADQLAVSLDDLVDCAVLVKKRTHKDTFKTKNIALHLWIDQAHRDRNGDEIKILDVYLGKTHVDHVKSVRDGGTTTYENAELMMATDNLSKGAKSNPPAFPHQEQEDYGFPQDQFCAQALVDSITGAVYNKNT